MSHRFDERASAIISAWVLTVSRHPLLVLSILVPLVTAALVYTGNGLRVDTDTSNLFSAELPWRRTQERFEQAFPQHVETLLVVIDGPTPGRTRDAARRLAARLRAQEDLIEAVYAPGAEPFFERQAPLYLDLEELEVLADRLSKLQPVLSGLVHDQSLRGMLGVLEDAVEAAREDTSIDLELVVSHMNASVERHLGSPSVTRSWQELMSGEEEGVEARRQVLVVRPRFDFGALRPAGASVEAVRRIAAGIGIDESHGLRLRLSGTVALEYEEMESVSRGAATAAVASLTFALAALWFAFRSAKLVAASLLTLIAGLVLTAAFATATVGALNLISIAFAVLYIGLGVDFAIHLGVRYRDLRSEGVDNGPALERSARDVGPSLLVCAITTAVGFYSFIPTDYVGVSELGVISGSSMFVSLALNLTLLPALLSTAPFRPSGIRGSAPLRGGLERLVELPLRHPVAIRRCAIALAATAVALLPLVRFDYDSLNLRDPGSESVQTFRDLQDEGAMPLRAVTLLADGEAEAAALVARLRELPSVDSVASLDDFVPDDQNDKLAEIDYIGVILEPLFQPREVQEGPSQEEQLQALRSFLPALRTLLDSDQPPTWRAEAELLHASLERLLESLQGLGSEAATRQIARLEAELFGTFEEAIDTIRTSLGAEFVTLSELPRSLVPSWRTADGTLRIEAFPTGDLSDSRALRRFVSEVRSVSKHATGTPVISLESGEAVVGALRRAFAGALVLICVLLFFVLRSAVDEVLVLVPLLWGALLTGLGSVLLDVPFNFANIIALPLLLGIGVDSGIHAVLRMRSSGDSYAQWLRSSTARGVYYSALTTIGSFVSLTISAHPGTASMGLLLTVGVLSTLVGTLVVLPALLVGSSMRGRTRAPEPGP
jgi:hopanoid biosynthesis associated RND transporter like protein HpnN